MPSNDERRAQLQAELAQLENESREDKVNSQVDDLELPDVIAHLVAHSAGYPTQDDREVHARVVRKHYKRDEYAQDEAEPQDERPQVQAEQPGQPQGWEVNTTGTVRPE